MARSYGEGDGATTFTLPDGRGRFPRSPASGLGGGVGGAATHSHTNPSTGSSGEHSHTNSSTSVAGGYSHSNPVTGASGTHNHGKTSTPDLHDVATTGGADLIPDDAHQHDIPPAGAHTHTQGSTGSQSGHAHGVTDTAAVASHTHTQAATQSESNLPPYLELWMIVAT